MNRRDALLAQIASLKVLRDNALAKREEEDRGVEHARQRVASAENELALAKQDLKAAQAQAKAARKVDQAVIETYDFRIAEFEDELKQLPEPPKPPSRPKTKEGNR